MNYTSMCAFSVSILFTIASAAPSVAQELVGSYVAYIGEDDLYNSNGVRLSAPWQVLRQDRANFHKFGRGQFADEWDAFFADGNNRAKMEAMVRNGYIDAKASRDIMKGGALVLVEIFGRDGRGNYIRVNVQR